MRAACTPCEGLSAGHNCLDTSTCLPPPNMIAIAASTPAVWTTDGLSDPNRHIIGCRIHTPKLVLTVYQVRQAPPHRSCAACLLQGRTCCPLPRRDTGVERPSRQGGGTGCSLADRLWPTFKITAHTMPSLQVSGADQAAAHPEEAWAAPYTWWVVGSGM